MGQMKRLRPYLGDDWYTQRIEFFNCHLSKCGRACYSCKSGYESSSIVGIGRETTSTAVTYYISSITSFCLLKTMYNTI